MITHSYKLDMCPGGVPLAITLSQYDSDVQLVFELFASRGTFVIESGTTVAIRGTKPDGNGIDLDAAISDNVVTVSVTQQMTAVAGTSYYELTLYKSEKELNTANFRLIIERAALDKDTLISGSEIRELVDIIDRADEIIQAAADIQQTAEDLQEYVDAKEAEISQITTDAEETAQEALDEVTNVKNDLSQNYPKIVESDAIEPDLDIADPSGNVIVRLQDGHIKTKEFDSADAMQDIADIQDDISELSSGKINIQQAVSDAGKALVIGADGMVSPADVSVSVDATLTQEGKAADAKAVGDAIVGNVKVADSDATSDLDIADSQGNAILRLENGHIKTKNFDSSDILYGYEYKFSGSDLLLSYGYNDIYDAVVVLNCGRANGLFDFSALKTKPKGSSLKNYETADLINVWTSNTDMHAPFQFLVTNNADGYHADATSSDFTGGNHTLDNMGANYKTASSRYVYFFADGKPVSSGCGKFLKFEIRWANNVQAYNCVKSGGGGRTSLVEYHNMIFDGIKFSEDVKLVPLEEIIMSLWYGFQCVSIGNTYTMVEFIDGSNRIPFNTSDSNIVSGNDMTSGLVSYGTNHKIEMRVDTTCDLGKRTYYSGSKGAFVSNNKGYFSVIGERVTMPANSVYYLRGYYRFCPNMS